MFSLIFVVKIEFLMVFLYTSIIQNNYLMVFGHGHDPWSWTIIMVHDDESWSWIMTMDNYHVSWSWMMIMDHYHGSWSWMMIMDHYHESWSIMMIMDHYMDHDHELWKIVSTYITNYFFVCWWDGKQNIVFSAGKTLGPLTFRI